MYILIISKNLRLTKALAEVTIESGEDNEVEDNIAEFALTIDGGGDEQLLLSSAPVKEFEIWNNSDIFSSTFGIWNLFDEFEESFFKESKSCDIWASASAVSRLSCDLYWGVVVVVTPKSGKIKILLKDAQLVQLLSR